MGRSMLIGTVVLLLGLAMVLGSSLTGQQAVAQEDEEEEAGYLNDYIEALRQDVRTNKRDLISWNMELTTKESAAFWPVYRKYEYDLSSVNNEMVSLVTEYATKGGMLSDDDAGQMLRRRFDLPAGPQGREVLPVGQGDRHADRHRRYVRDPSRYRQGIDGRPRAVGDWERNWLPVWMT